MLITLSKDKFDTYLASKEVSAEMELQYFLNGPKFHSWDYRSAKDH